MKTQLAVGGIIMMLLYGTQQAAADNLTKASALLCATSWAMVCTSDEVCQPGAPWQWDIPQFIEVDLKKEILSSTEASGENRTTPAEVLRRENGRIVIQGEEFDRAFSIFVEEESGRMSAAIAGENMTVAIFGACTQLKTGK